MRYKWKDRSKIGFKPSDYFYPVDRVGKAILTVYPDELKTWLEETRGGHP